MWYSCGTRLGPQIQANVVSDSSFLFNGDRDNVIESILGE